MSKRCNAVVNTNTCFLLNLPNELLEKILKLLLDPVEFQAEPPMSFLRFVVTTKQVCSFPKYRMVVMPLWEGYNAELDREKEAIQAIWDKTSLPFDSPAREILEKELCDLIHFDIRRRAFAPVSL